MAVRGSNVKEMDTMETRQLLKFDCSTSAFLGMRSWLREATGGTAVVVTDYKDMRAAGPPPPRTRNGVLVCNSAGIATSVDLSKAGRLGTLFIAEGLEVYPGMIFGETNDMSDIDTNICRKHDGYKSAGAMLPPAEKKLEQALTYILEDEQLEVTPKRIVMRKMILDAGERKNAEKQAAKL